jgi:hypothetical protein
VRGSGFNCALLADTTVTCWGDNELGQLGNGATAKHSAPTLVVAPGQGAIGWVKR